MKEKKEGREGGRDIGEKTEEEEVLGGRRKDEKGEIEREEEEVKGRY